MKRSSICVLVALVACIGHAAAARPDLLNADDDDHSGITASLRHLSSTDDPNYNSIITSEDDDAIHVPAPKGASLKKGRSGRIAYGKPVAKDQFPTVVWLNLGDSICTGTLIAKKAILTAAHCVVADNGGLISPKTVEVGFGSEYYDYTDTYLIDLIVTAKYDPDSNYGDVALMRLTKPIATKYVALATTTTKLTAKVDVVGRGEIPGGSTPDVMYYTSVSTMTTARCTTEHNSIFGEDQPIGSMCFGLDKNPSTQSCGGDSGGPYFTTGTKKIQVGLVSYGPDITCGSTVNNLEIATSVGYWRKWIDTVLTKYKMR